MRMYSLSRSMTEHFLFEIQSSCRHCFTTLQKCLCANFVARICTDILFVLWVYYSDMMIEKSQRTRMIGFVILIELSDLERIGNVFWPRRVLDISWKHRRGSSEEYSQHCCKQCRFRRSANISAFHFSMRHSIFDIIVTERVLNFAIKFQTSCRIL